MRILAEWVLALSHIGVVDHGVVLGPNGQEDKLDVRLACGVPVSLTPVDLEAIDDDLPCHALPRREDLPADAACHEGQPDVAGACALK